MMDVIVENARDSDSRQWDALVEASMHGSIFHTWKFLKTIERHSASRLYPLLGFRGTEIIGLYPLYFSRKFPLKMVFSPPPHCAVPYLGPVICGYQGFKQSERETVYVEFQKAVDDFIASEFGADYVSIYTPLGLMDSRPLRWAGYRVEPLYEYLLDLSVGPDVIWSQLKKKLRNNISRERRQDVTISPGSREDLERIYEMMLNRYKEQGRVVNVPKDYLMELYDTLHQQNMRIYVAKHGEEIHGGLIDLYYKGKACSWIGNSKPYSDNVSSNDLLQWEAICHAYDSGCRYYEEVGAGIERLCRYKSKYNPSLRVYFSAKKYSSVIPQAFEYGYSNVMKPLLEKIKNANRA